MSSSSSLKTSWLSSSFSALMLAAALRRNTKTNMIFKALPARKMLSDTVVKRVRPYLKGYGGESSRAGANDEDCVGRNRCSLPVAGVDREQARADHR